MKKNLFYFDVQNGETYRDMTGTVFSSLEKARAVSVLVLGECLNERAESFWADPQLTLTVRGDEGQVLMTLAVVGTSGTPAPATGQSSSGSSPPG